jgi:hypothetical protein
LFVNISYPKGIGDFRLHLKKKQTMIIENSTDEEVRADFLSTIDSILEKPTPKVLIIAEGKERHRDVYAYFWSSEKWCITRSINSPYQDYMFKKDGLFGYSSNRQDFEKNLFETLEEAIACFHKFYKK